MSLSLVTLVADRADHLIELLAGVARSDDPPDEVVVVDMGSTDQPRRRVAEAGVGLDVRWIDVERRDRRLPLARARNAGARQASGEQLMFLDVDCIPSCRAVGDYRRAIERGGVCTGIVRYLERFWDRDLGVDRCTAAEVDPGGADQTAADQTAADRIDGALWFRSSPHPARPTPSSEHCGQDHERFWSLAFGLDRATFERVGGFDPGFEGYGGEDTDFAFAARAAGVPMRWMVDGLAFHQFHTSTSPPVGHLDDIVANARRFRSKWGRWPMEGWLAAFARDGLVEWCPEGAELERVGERGADRRTPPRVLSIPGSHPYTRRVLPTDHEVDGDPTDPWWPHPGLEGDWVAGLTPGPDVVHLHFGFDHRSPSELRHWCDGLGRAGQALVVTVHDLDSPHVVDRAEHEGRLAVLLDRADEVLTLTPGAAAEIAARWGRTAIVTPHPHLAPLDWEERLGPRARHVRPRIGVHLKGFRRNLLDPLELLDGLAGAAEDRGSELVIQVAAAGDASCRRLVERWGTARRIGVDVVERPDDMDLLRHLASLDVSVLPYAFGTHSGWLELCKDLGTRIVAPELGYYRQQWSDVEEFEVVDRRWADPGSVRAAVVRALDRPPPDRPDPERRRAELASVRNVHAAVYRSVTSVSRSGSIGARRAPEVTP